MPIVTPAQDQPTPVGMHGLVVGSWNVPTTPAVDLLRGIDLPLLNYARALGVDSARLDSDMEAFATHHGKALNRRLLKYLKAKLTKQPSTRHVQAACASAAYLRYPERRPSPTLWPASILPLLRDGHAVNLFVYPDLPARIDLDQIRDAIGQARKYGRGLWSRRPPVLQPCEYRWIADMITGKSSAPELYCGDFADQKLYSPQQYYLVAEECRVWFCSHDVGVASKLGYKLQ